MEEQRISASFINVFVYFITKQWFARFLKIFICLLPKLSATRTLRLCRSLCLRHLREIVCFHLRALPPLCATFICSRLNLSLHISEEQKLLSRICTLYLCRSLCRRHLRDIALPPSLRYSVCLLYKTFSLSLHISEEPDNISKKVRL